jgi:hypothetical protein
MKYWDSLCLSMCQPIHRVNADLKQGVAKSASDASERSNVKSNGIRRPGSVSRSISSYSKICRTHFVRIATSTFAADINLNCFFQFVSLQWVRHADLSFAASLAANHRLDGRNPSTRAEAWISCEVTPSNYFIQGLTGRSQTMAAASLAEHFHHVVHPKQSVQRLTLCRAD